MSGGHPTTAEALDLFRSMARIRAFEECVRDRYLAGEVPGAGHSYLGEEAVAAGVCAALDGRDRVVSTYRGHGHSIARGASLDRLMAEVLCKEAGYCRGRGGSMHAAGLDVGVLGTTGIVGGGSPVALGAAYAQQTADAGGVTVVFFGDGASDRGTQHEAMNMAALYRLPVVFAVENNAFAFYTAQERHQTVRDIADRAAAYGIFGATVDGNDAEAVLHATSEAVSRCRSGAGPVLLEFKTWRWLGHYIDDPAPYKNPAEQERWVTERDPLKLYRVCLVREHGVSMRELDAVEDAARREVAHALAFAREAPDPNPATVLEGVYGDVPREDAPITPSVEIEADGADAPAFDVAKPPSRAIRLGKALREGITQAMEADGSIFVAGEDVSWGGVAKHYWGLAERFPGRVLDTPISETAITGLGLGAALMGMRPLLEYNLVDFTLVAMDEIMNEAAKWRYMHGGTQDVPLVMVAACGMGSGSTAQHSQSLEALFTHIPGLKVVFPSNAYDAKGLVATALRGNDPVLFLHDLRLQDDVCPVPEEPYAVPFGRMRVARWGSDISIVTYGAAVPCALEAAEELAVEGVFAEVVDLRTLVPLDEDGVLASARKTGRVLVVHDAVRFGGFGAEVAAMVAERVFQSLRAPVARLGAPWCPVPASPALKEGYLVTARAIAERARALVNGS